MDKEKCGSDDFWRLGETARHHIRIAAVDAVWMDRGGGWGLANAFNLGDYVIETLREDGEW